MARRRLALLLGCVNDESGQALVEAALVLPLLLLLVFGVVAIGRVTQAKVAVQATAREASRALAEAPSEAEGVSDGAAAGQRAADGYGLAADRLTLKVDANGFVRGGDVEARASYAVPLGDLPLLSLLDVDVSAIQHEQVERYRSREGGP